MILFQQYYIINVNIHNVVFDNIMISSICSYYKLLTCQKNIMFYKSYFFFLYIKRVKPKSIKDTDLTHGWRYSLRINLLLGIQMNRKQQPISVWPAGFEPGFTVLGLIPQAPLDYHHWFFYKSYWLQRDNFYRFKNVQQ